MLKTLTLLCIALALASARIAVDGTKRATVVLVDTSASIPHADLDRASKLVNDIDAQRGRHWLRVIPFARSSREVDATEVAKGWSLKQSAGDIGRGTDLEAAVR